MSTRSKSVVSPSPEAIEVLLAILRQSSEPSSAAQLAKRTVKPHKLNEASVTQVLEEQVSRGELRRFAGTTAKGKPRYWDRDEAAFVSGAIAALLDKKGPQTKAVVLKAAKGISATVAANALQSLIDSRRVFEHPPIGKSKIVKYGAMPPAPEPYLEQVSSQLATTVSHLTSVGVKRDVLARAVLEMIAQCGLSLPQCVPSSSTQSENVSHRALDLLMLMKQIEVGADRGALVSVRDLRRAAKLNKSHFDGAVLDLARSGKIMLHRHDYPSGLSPAERDELITDDAGSYFVGVAIRPTDC